MWDVTSTEWRLEDAQTKLWTGGIQMPDGEVLQLIAWEVMAPSWRINDAHGAWGEPAVDFLAVDESGRPVVIELKRRLTAPVPVWRAVCQVTHGALALAG